MSKITTAEKAVEWISDGMTILVAGFVGSACPDEVMKALGDRHRATKAPKNLTVFYPASGGNKKDAGVDHWAQDGMISLYITSHLGFCPQLAEMIFNDKIETHMIPLGPIMHMVRAKAAGMPGVWTNVGVGTFIDPRLESGWCNNVHNRKMSEVVTVDGKEYLFFRPPHVDVAIIRATTADTKGNLTFEKEPVLFDAFYFAQAAKASGGKVIVQVERITEAGTLNPKQVFCPGQLVDYIVEAAPEYHVQNFSGAKYNPSLSGETRAPLAALDPEPMSDRKIIARRAAMELFSGAVVNLGVGVPEGVSRVAAEEGFAEQITLTVEAGPWGGRPAGGLAFGCAMNPDAIINPISMLDFYDGGGIDVGCLGLAEVDQYGNLNVSKFGGRVVGPGGFINISQNSKTVIYCGTFTAGGLKIASGDGKVTILQEGKNKKFVPDVMQVTYSGKYAASVGQKVFYVTERAVFTLTKEGMVLIEIAPGIDLQTQILDQMLFKPIVSPDLKLMDERIFLDKPMGLKV